MATPRAADLARHGCFYRRLLWLYPASFRREYGPAMAQVFSDRLRDEARDRPRAAAARVWLHTLRDLAVSVPNQRIEAFMSEQQTTARLGALIVAVALCTVAITVIGPPAIIPLAAVAAWLTYQHRRGRYVRLPRQSNWYRWVLAGAALLAVTATAILSFDMGDLVYSLWALLTVAGVFACAIGIAVGVRDHHRGPMQPG